jgi:hypothetical protein
MCWLLYAPELLSKNNCHPVSELPSFLTCHDLVQTVKSNHGFTQKQPYTYTLQQKTEQLVLVSLHSHVRDRQNIPWYTTKPRVPCHHCEHEKSQHKTVSLLPAVQYSVSLDTWYEMPLTRIFTLFITTNML